MPVRFGSRLVGDGYPCFVTYEIGPTHSGVESAKRLIRLAAQAGADAVKFQIFDPDRLVADKKQLFSYEILKDRETGDVERVEEPLYDILKRRSLSVAEWRAVKKFCDDHGLAFFATVGFDEDVDLLIELGCQSIKIASADVNHYPLIRKAARTGMCIQLDTGMATLGEIEEAVDVVLSEGNDNIIIHQCPSGYPARLESVNLNIIRTLKQIFPFPVAFSDHTPGYEMDIAALALGANVLEKTITEDRTIRSIEHIFSLEGEEISAFVKTVRDIEMAFANARRILHDEEKTKRIAYRRSVFLRSPASKGERLMDCDIEFRRPGFGISPVRYEEVAHAFLNKDCGAGYMLKESDLTVTDN